MNKLTDIELSQLQDTSNHYNQIKIQLADAYIAQSNYLKQIEALKERYIEQEDAILMKYGKDTVINMNTGEIKNGSD
jgi:hypothetical protein